jgi:hypothetical protein
MTDEEKRALLRAFFARWAELIYQDMRTTHAREFVTLVVKRSLDEDEWNELVDMCDSVVDSLEASAEEI